ncbi:tyrosine-type recombinase/integrase [Rhodobacter maris]|uniref:tyrosine-type recombinase/integrase n=1 Tax=Rhodobacter maris TaxID=446682 RepID=UPI000BE36309
MSKGQNVKSAPFGAVDAHERRRDYLSPPDMDRLLAGAKKGRHGARDYLVLLMMYRHGLRVSEATALCRKDLDLEQSRLWVARLKNGLSFEQPIGGDDPQKETRVPADLRRTGPPEMAPRVLHRPWQSRCNEHESDLAGR